MSFSVCLQGRPIKTWDTQGAAETHAAAIRKVTRLRLGGDFVTIVELAPPAPVESTHDAPPPAPAKEKAVPHA